VTVYIHERTRRRGIGPALYTTLFDLLRAQGYTTAHGGITLPNAASVGLHEALGFTPAGVYRNVGYELGAWHDVGWWQLALQPLSASPAEPRDLAAVRDTPAAPAAFAAGTRLCKPHADPPRSREPLSEESSAARRAGPADAAVRLRRLAAGSRPRQRPAGPSTARLRTLETILLR
jgi:hypothetical protein